MQMRRRRRIRLIVLPAGRGATKRNEQSAAIQSRLPSAIIKRREEIVAQDCRDTTIGCERARLIVFAAVAR